MITSNDIFKRDSTGRTRFWRYEVDGPRWRSIAGVCGGTEVVSGWTTCEPKSQPTAEAQALFEAQAEEKKKLDRVYRRTLVELSDGSMMFEPMLAKKYEDFPGRCYSQPKLDGIRCVATAEGLFSRQGKPITGLPHIEEALKPVFDKHPEVVLDGELYNHGMKDQFEKIVSAVRKKAGHPDAGKVQYHLYDAHLGGDEPFSERRQWLLNTFLDVFEITPGCLQHVPTDHVGTADLLDALYGEYLEDGYEGQMVRLDRPYENKRSGSLLKRKEFDDGEFKIRAVLEGNGNWAGFAKRLEIELPDGRVCGAGVKGSQDHARTMLVERDEYVGGTATIRHFGFTNDGMPRFPVAVAAYKGKRDL